MLFSFSIFVSALIAGASASNVLELTPDNFDSIVGQGQPALVEFFAPWCGHCKNLAPVYEELADAFAHAKDKVVIAKVDADGVGKPLGKKYGVTGYPTLKWFDGKGEDVKYESGRDLESLAGFITSKTGVKAKIPGPPPTDVTILDNHNFDEVALDTSKNVIVSFTAPWCGHCKNLKPHYEQVAKTFKSESDCVVANIDADDKKNMQISQKYEIAGFPTIKFFSKDNKEPVDYDGGRTEADIVAYLNEKCGTQRAVGGGLNDEAGRLAEFDTLAHKFFTAPADARDALYKDALQLAATSGTASKHYIRVMEKVVNGTAGYVEKETKRLGSILAKRNLAPAKLDEIKIKANILTSFLEDREASKEKVARAESEL
ncbi:protein disulfide isomerase [Pholiota conissans]|uniref:protein disulfide-isomerase n=1 Tax=Pholiota conissans TaxID=109636 RepID=A0A9P5YMB3_9AGAR|nr:protein disulfide isomerase [Pholiota conissans]